MSTTQLVFFGELLPGHEPDQVKRALVAHLKLSPAQLAPVLSGRRVVLKQGLSSEEAQRYCSYLATLGLRTFAEAG